MSDYPLIEELMGDGNYRDELLSILDFYGRLITDSRAGNQHHDVHNFPELLGELIDLKKESEELPLLVREYFSGDLKSLDEAIKTQRFFSKGMNETLSSKQRAKQQ